MGGWEPKLTNSVVNVIAEIGADDCGSAKARLKLLNMSVILERAVKIHIPFHKHEREQNPGV